MIKLESDKILTKEGISMKTDIYKFTADSFEIGKVMGSAAKAASYNDLTSKQELRLTLLAEELAEMIPKLLEYGDGEFFIENKGADYEIHIKVHASELLNFDKRDKLLSVSKSGKNAAATGIMNKIIIVAESLISGYNDAPVGINEYSNNFVTLGMDMDPYYWSLKKYRSGSVENTEAWDELEKSIIANLSDDVTVGFIKGTAEIIVKKSF